MEKYTTENYISEGPQESGALIESDISRALSACEEISDRLQRCRGRLDDKANVLFGERLQDGNSEKDAENKPSGTIQTLHQRHDKILQLIESVSLQIERLERL